MFKQRVDSHVNIMDSATWNGTQSTNARSKDSEGAGVAKNENLSELY